MAAPLFVVDRFVPVALVMDYLIDLARHAQPESDRLCRFLRFRAHPAAASKFPQDPIFVIPSMIL
jgi:hypothetical protein